MIWVKEVHAYETVMTELILTPVKVF